MEDPKQLALEEDWLLKHPEPADLNLYLEDDLVIHDRLWPEKVLWMAECSDQKAVLLPHRYEALRVLVPPRGCMWMVVLTRARSWLGINPRQPWRADLSGCSPCTLMSRKPSCGLFWLSRQQVERLRDEHYRVRVRWAPETAATYAVGTFFTLLKPAWQHREFLYR